MFRYHIYDVWHVFGRLPSIIGCAMLAAAAMSEVS